MQVVSCFGLLLMAERRASAYTDPGSGVLLWQLLLAGMVGTMFYFHQMVKYWKKIQRMRAWRFLGCVFALLYVVAATLLIRLFGTGPAPRFMGIYLIGVLLTAYLFSWQSGAFLFLISVAANVYFLRSPGAFKLDGSWDIYRLIFYSAVATLVICSVCRLKAETRPGPVEKESGLTELAKK